MAAWYEALGVVVDGVEPVPLFGGPPVGSVTPWSLRQLR
jgi:hypothetical protein